MDGGTDRFVSCYRLVNRFFRVVFGVSGSPSLLKTTVRDREIKYKECHPTFLHKLLDSFYVNDFVGAGGGGGVEPAPWRL